MRSLLAVLLVMGCSAEPDRPSATIDTLPGGVIHVVNHAPAQWSDTTGWKIELQGQKSFPFDSAGSLDAPNYPHRLANGEMVVLNQLPPFVQRYGADFTPLARFGREGSGPGEFRNVALRAFGDSVVIFDESRSAVILTDREGNLISESLVPTFTDWMGDRDTRGLLPLLGRYGAGSGAGVMWWSFAERRAVDSIIGPPAPEERMWRSCSFVIPYQPSLDLAPTPSGQAWFGTSDADRFVLTRHGRDTLRLVETPGRPRFPVSTTRVDEFFDPNGFLWKQCGAEMKRSDIPTTSPAWSSLTVDADGHLWVSRRAEWGRSYDVYDPDGLWLGEVPSPFTADENVYWSGDDILSVSSPGEQGYTLRRYRIVRKAPN
ncbi:MAG: hypothetical protein SFU84_01355 [Gemmatimonadales bacterium]|nr:hypothetical protein [Gemmatimonadales bacterium]